MPAKKRPLKAVGSEKETRTNGAASARSEAVKRLISAYPDDWKAFLAEEREKRGLAESGRQTRVQKLVGKMREAGMSDDDINSALADAGFKARV